MQVGFEGSAQDGVGISSGRVLKPGHAHPAKRPRLGDANVGWAMACAGRMHRRMHLGGEGGGRRRSVGVRMRDAPSRACGDEASWRGRACVLGLQCSNATSRCTPGRRPSLPSPSPLRFEGLAYHVCIYAELDRRGQVTRRATKTGHQAKPSHQACS